MITFFTLLFIILGVNMVMMFLNLGGANQKAKKRSAEISDTSTSEIQSIDLISSEYKEAV